MITEYTPEQIDDAVVDEVHELAPGTVADYIDDEIENALKIFIKRDSAGKATGYAIVTAERKMGIFLRSLEPPNDVELLDAVFKAFKTVKLDYGDEEGAKKYLEKRALEQVAKAKGVPEGVLSAGRRRRMTVRRKRVHGKTRKIRVRSRFLHRR